MGRSGNGDAWREINTAIANEYAWGGYPTPMSRRAYIKSETIDQIDWPTWLIFVPMFAGLLPLFIFGPRLALWILGVVYAFGLLVLAWRFIRAWRESAWRR